ncbi:MAG: hypothetical protein JWP11_2929 [Frankiales bacterium]|nr:hypothetical protein [Frankiales bacterium]
MTLEPMRGALDLPCVGRIGLLLPVVRDADPPHVREGQARRRLTLLTSECPCGARIAPPNRPARRAMKRDLARGGGLWEVRVQHEPDCPAGDPRLDEVTSA